MKVFHAFQMVLKTFLPFILRMKRINCENIPKEGPFIICANHIAAIDVLAVAFSMNRPIRFIGKKELFKGISGVFMKMLGVIPVDTTAIDTKAIRTMMRHAQAGEIIGIFPQGTRVRDKEPDMELVHGGVGFFAAYCKTTVVPAGIYTKNYRYRFPNPFYIKWGKPITLDQYEGLIKERDYQKISEYFFSECIKLTAEAKELAENKGGKR